MGGIFLERLLAKRPLEARSREQPGRAAPEHSLFDTRIRRFVPAAAG